MHFGVVDRRLQQVAWQELDAPDIEYGSGVCWHPQGWFAIAGKTRIWRLAPGATEAHLEAVDDAPDTPWPAKDRWGFRSLFVKPPLWVVGGTEVEVWHEGERRVVARIDERASSGENAQISPDGKWLSVSNADGLALFRTSDWKLAERVEGDATYASHSWAPDSSCCVVVAEGRLIGLSLAASGAFSRIQAVAVGQAHGSIFAGPHRVVLSANHGIVVCDLTRSTLTEHIPHLPSCVDADLRGATGLSVEVLTAMANAGARV